MAEIAIIDEGMESINNLQHFAHLTQIQKIVLAKMLEGMTTDLIYTDIELAERAGVDRTTVWKCKQDEHFLSCLREATRNLTSSEAPAAIRALKQKAFEGNVRAIDLLLRYTGDYVPKSQVESKSQNFNINAEINAEDPIGEFVSMLCHRGWNRERIHAEIDRVYDELKEQGGII